MIYIIIFYPSDNIKCYFSDKTRVYIIIIIDVTKHCSFTTLIGATREDLEGA